MRAGGAESELNDRTGTQADRAAHGQRLTSRSGAGFEDRAARGDRDRTVNSASTFENATAIIDSHRAAGSERASYIQCAGVDGGCTGVSVHAAQRPGSASAFGER